MSLLQLNEICPGLVAFLDPAILKRYGVAGPSLADEVHPFVCVEVCGHRSTWTMLTSKPGHGRPSLPSQFKQGQCASWLENQSYLSQALEGPSHAFQEASAKSELSRPGCRHSVTEKGVAFVLNHIRRPDSRSA